jgi:AcrR family transcriptional regulator
MINQIGRSFNQDWSDTVPEQTRDRIVDAAWRVLERDGYAATSVKNIAQEAGVAQGLVHYYFSSKELLVVAAVNRCCDELSSIDSSTDAATMARAGFAQARAQTPEMLAARRVLLEMAGRALHDEAIRDALLVYLRGQRRSVQEAVETVLGDVAGVPPTLVRAAGPALDAALFGIWAIGLIDPTFDTGEAIGALSELSLRALSTVNVGAGETS